MRPEKVLAAGQWDIPCPACGGPLELRTTPERISNPQNAYGMSKLGQEMVAVTSADGTTFRPSPLRLTASSRFAQSFTRVFG